MKAEKEEITTEINSLTAELKERRKNILSSPTISMSDDVKLKASADTEIVKYLRKQLKEKESSLECPVCLETASVPIFACPEMHLICSSCCPKLQECPECRAKYQDPPKRHRFREETAAEIEKLKTELHQLLNFN